MMQWTASECKGGLSVEPVATNFVFRVLDLCGRCCCFVSFRFVLFCFCRFLWFCGAHYRILAGEILLWVSSCWSFFGLSYLHDSVHLLYFVQCVFHSSLLTLCDL